MGEVSGRGSGGLACGSVGKSSGIGARGEGMEWGLRGGRPARGATSEDGRGQAAFD